MAHHKSAKKRIKTTEKRNLYNRSIKSRVKTYVRHFTDAVEAATADAANLVSHKADAEAKLKNAVSELQRAAGKGVLHRSTAGRKVGRLQLQFNKVFSA